MKKLLGLVGLGVVLMGCAGEASESDTESATEAISDSLRLRVDSFASEKKIAEYGTHERVFGTRRPDDQMKAEMLPRVRAAATAQLAAACEYVTSGQGQLEGAPREEHVRAERIFYVTEFIVEVQNVQTCVVPRSAMEPRAAELVKAWAEGKHFGAVHSALVELKEASAPPLLAAIEARIGADGKLDVAEDGPHGVTNWTINYVIRLVQVLKDIKTENARALPVLRKLRAAVSTGNGSAWASGEVDRAIEALTH